MRRTKEEAEKTRLALISAGLTHFSNDGVEKTAISRLVQTANLTRGAFYWHFENKWQLFDAIWRHYASPFHQLMDDSLSQQSPGVLNAFSQLLKEFLVELERDPSLNQLMILLIRESTFWKGEIPESVTICLNDFHQRRTELLNRAKEQGELPAAFDSEAGSMWIKLMLDGFILNWLQQPKAHSPAKLADHFVDELFNQLKNR